MNTFVFQYIPQSGMKDIPYIDLHINFFKNRKDIYLVEKVELDIGIRVYSYKAVKKLNMFMPITCKNEDISDLYDIISNDKELDLIFNDNVQIFKKYYNYCYAEFQSSKQLLLVKIKSYSQINLVNFKSQEFGKSVIGTEIYIDLERILSEIEKSNNEVLSDNDCIYLRFRVKGYLQNQVVKALKPPRFSSLLCSGTYPVSQIINFNFNDIRNIDKSYLNDYMGKNGAQLITLKSIKFFTAEPCECSIESLVPIPFKVRLMDENIWRKYLEEDSSLFTDMLIYKWSFNINQSERNNGLLTYKRHFIKVNRWTLMVYFALSICVGGIASYLIYLLTNMK